MSLEDFQLLDNEPIDSFIMKRDYLILYHIPGANLNDSNENVEFKFGENKNYRQIGNAYLEFDKPVRNAAAIFDKTSEIRLKIIAFAYCFKEAFLSTAGGSDLEHNKFVGLVTTCLRL